MLHILVIAYSTCRLWELYTKSQAELADLFFHPYLPQRLGEGGHTKRVAEKKGLPKCEKWWDSGIRQPGAAPWQPVTLCQAPQGNVGVSRHFAEERKCDNNCLKKKEVESWEVFSCLVSTKQAVVMLRVTFPEREKKENSLPGPSCLHTASLLGSLPVGHTHPLSSLTRAEPGYIMSITLHVD